MRDGDLAIEPAPDITLSPPNDATQPPNKGKTPLVSEREVGADPSPIEQKEKGKGRFGLSKSNGTPTKDATQKDAAKDTAAKTSKNAVKILVKGLKPGASGQAANAEKVSKDGAPKTAKKTGAAAAEEKEKKVSISSKAMLSLCETRGLPLVFL